MVANVYQFPKGRIDSLTSHLVKKCPALPLRDRQRAILQFHELPDLPDNMPNALNTAPNGQMMSLPYAPPKHTASAFGGLEVLAEVSRQHLDLTGQRALRRSSTRDTGALNGFSPDEFLVSDERTLDEGNLPDRTSKSYPLLGHALSGRMASGDAPGFTAVRKYHALCARCSHYSVALKLSRWLALAHFLEMIFASSNSHA